MARPRDRTPDKLPRGKHGLSPAFVAQNQRERLLSAMIDAVAESGYAETTVADVLEWSGISRKTFYDMFASKEECFLEAYDGLIEGLSTRIGAAYATEAKWPERVRASLRELLDALSERPAAARVGLVEVLAAGPRALERYDQALRRFVPLLEDGRTESPYGSQLPPNISEAVVGGVAQVLYLRVLTGDVEGVTDALDELLYFALVPYLGHARATRITYARRPGASAQDA